MNAAPTVGSNRTCLHYYILRDISEKKKLIFQKKHCTKNGVTNEIRTSFMKTFLKCRRKHNRLTLAVNFVLS